MTDIIGTNKSDELIGTSADDTINAKGGNDTLYGQEGNDTLLGAGGNDILYGGSGNDVLNGGAGSDNSYGEEGNDTIIYVSGENKGEFDIASGGTGYDTFTIYLTSKEFALPWVKNAIQGYIDFLNINANQSTETATFFNFSLFNPKPSGLLNINVSNFEAFKVFVNGVLTVDFSTPVNQSPVAMDDGSVSSPLSGTEDTSKVINVLANDSDPDSNPLTVSSVGSPSHGTAVKNADNTITYTPAANYNGSDSFSYTISDGQGGTATANVYLSLAAVNDAPVAVDDSKTLAEDGAVIINVLANDTDVDGNTLTVTDVGLASHGVAVLNGDQTITYTPSLNYNGTDSFSYTISDGEGGSSTATVNLTITAVNDAPVAVDDSKTLAEDGAVIINVLANDTDVDGNTLTVTDIGLASHGVAVLNGDQTITYTPSLNYNGTDSFSYTISDGQGGSSTATVNLTITAVNDAPVAVDDSKTLAEDGAVIINVLANDTDVDGNMLTVTDIGLASHGVAVLNGDQTITYTPSLNYNGTDSFSYTISDGQGGSSTATVNLTITAVNDAPVAVDDSKTLAEDGAVIINVLANDTDVDGNTLTVTDVGLASHGVAVLNGDQTITYTPSLNYNGSDSFSYTISDGQGGSSTATVNLTITAVNDAPVAVDDSKTLAEDGAVIINVLANDTDVDGNTLTVTDVGLASHGVAVLNGDQTITYTPSLNYNGSDSFSYTISDGQGGSSTATVNLTITAVNDAPESVDGGSTVLFENINDSNSLLGAVPDGFDVDGDSLTYALVNPAGLNGHAITFNANGTFLLEPAEFQHLAQGVEENLSFVYKAVDSQGGESLPASYSITVTGSNDVPTAVADIASVGENEVKSIDVLANDSDPDEGESLTLIDAFLSGGLGSVSIVDNKVQYDPGINYDYLALGETEVASVFYTILDSQGLTSSSSVDLTITAANDAPVSSDGASSFTDNINGGLMFGMVPMATDIDNDGFTGTYELVDDGDLAIVFNPDGTFSLDPAQFQHLPDGVVESKDFTYRAVDQHGLASTPSIFTVTVTGSNDAPTAVADVASVGENEVKSFDVLANDTDPDDNDVLTFTDVSLTGGFGIVFINEDNQLVYDASGNYESLSVGQTDSATITYVIQDSHGLTSSEIVNLTIVGENDAPFALEEVFTISEDQSWNIFPSFGDIDNNSTVIISAVQTPVHGSVSFTDNMISYTPDLNYFGEDLFIYTVIDEQGATSDAQVNLTILPEPDAPTTSDIGSSTERLLVSEDIPVTLDVLTSANDVDGEELTLSYASVLNSEAGEVEINLDNTLTFTPALDYSGFAEIQFEVMDSGGFPSNRSTIYLEILPVNDAPTAQDENIEIDEDRSFITIFPTFNDVDNSVTITTNSSPLSGIAFFDSSISINYTPNANFYGTDSFTYTVTDDLGASTEATIYITVNPVNDAPDAIDDGSIDPIYVLQGVAQSIYVVSNDIDIDNDPLTITGVSDPFSSTTIEFDALLNQYYLNVLAPVAGGYSMSYTISDGLQTNSANVFVFSIPFDSNFAPNAVDDGIITFEEDNSVTIDVLANDTTVSGVLSVAYVNQALHGEVLINFDNTITYTPFLNYSGPDSFDYFIVNSDGYYDRATVTLGITVEGNIAPIAVDDGSVLNPYLVMEDSSLLISNLVDNDTDENNDNLLITSVSDSVYATVVISPDHKTVLYTPVENYSGEDVFAYTISDGKGGVSGAVVYLFVEATPDNSLAVNDDFTVTEDTPTLLNVLSNDSDPDNLELSIQNYTQPIHGTVVVNEEGTGFIYSPNANFNGTDDFSYQASDGFGNESDVAIVNITVSPDNDAPYLDGSEVIQQSVAINTNLNVNIAQYFNDIEHNDLDYEFLGSIPSGTQLTLNAETGQLTFKSTNKGLYDLQFVARDRDLGQDPLYSQPLTLHVNVGNVQAIVANPDTLVTTDDVNSATVKLLGNLLSNDTGESSGRSIADLGISNLSFTLPGDISVAIGTLVASPLAKSANEAARYQIVPSGLLHNQQNLIAGFEFAAILSIMKNGDVFLTNNSTFDFLSLGSQVQVQFNYQEIDNFGQSASGSAQFTVSGADNEDVLSYLSVASPISGGVGEDVLVARVSATGADQSYDGGLGADWITYELLQKPDNYGVQVNLSTGLTQYFDNTGVTFLSLTDSLQNIENIKGSAYNDTLVGDGNDNIFMPGLGDDSVNGMAGIDTVSYRDASAGVTVDLTIVGSQDTVSAGLDSLSGIENIVGSQYNDTLIGDAGNNVLEGLLGNDIINGGAGIDTASYKTTFGGVNVNMALAGVSQNTVSAGSDTLISIEKLEGSSYGDNLWHKILDQNSEGVVFSGDVGLDGSLTITAANLSFDGGLGDDFLQINHDTFAALGDNTIDNNVRNITIDDIQDITLTGGEGNDSLHINSFIVGGTVINGSSYALISIKDSVLEGGNGNDNLQIIMNVFNNFGERAILENNQILAGAGNDFIKLSLNAEFSSDESFLLGAASSFINNTFSGGNGSDTFVVSFGSSVALSGYVSRLLRFDYNNTLDGGESANDFDILRLQTNESIAFQPEGTTINLLGVSGNIHGLEMIDLGTLAPDSEDNLILNYNEVFNMNDEHTLYVKGNALDSAFIGSGWTLQGFTFVTQDAPVDSFDIYNHYVQGGAHLYTQTNAGDDLQVFFT